MPEHRREGAAAEARRILAAVARTGVGVPVVLIDGPSGVGKTTVADALVSAWPETGLQRVNMDDLYPGWEGLGAASRAVVEHLLRPIRDRRTGWWRRWDWSEATAAEWHRASPLRPLLVEGCGSLSRESSDLADVRVWIDGERDVRRRRALSRDRGAFDPYWELWEGQTREFIARERPAELADLHLSIP